MNDEFASYTSDYLHQKINSFPVTETNNAIRYFQELVSRKLDAVNVIWYAVFKGDYGHNAWYQSQTHDWKVMDIVMPSNYQIDALKALKRYYYLCEKNGGLDPFFQVANDSFGATKVHLLRESVNIEEWNQHWMCKSLFRRGIGERMISSFSLSETSESVFLIDRKSDQKTFTKADAQEVYKLLISYPRLHYWLMLERGLVEPATRALSPRERQVVKLLLSNLTEIQIADELEIAKGTAHNYISSIYKSFNVGSRYELVQLWSSEVPIR